jgi:predicted house-cleaning noncanonical NTP pyrophosphatase (MazG superfamily)
MEPPQFERCTFGSWEIIEPSLNADPEFFGGKAIGLLRLPRHWAPPFIILTKRFRRLWDGSRCSSLVLDLLPSVDKEAFFRFIDLAAGQSKRVLVRSNSPTETGTSGRGEFRSIPARGDVRSVCQAIDEVLAQDPTLYATLQLAIEPGLPGHMSNERRVSPRRSMWLVEDNDDRFPQLRIKAPKTLAPAQSLDASSEHAVLQVLRRIAGYLQSLDEGYFHCEWVWDRQRVWLVQLDSMDLPDELLDANLYIQGADLWPFTFVPSWNGLKHFSQVNASKWRKLRRPKTFLKCGLPTADVFIITGTDWKEGGGAENPELAQDLVALCKHLAVIRCDVNSDEYTLLPTSAPTRDPRVLMDFMKKTFAGKGVPDEDWAFLIAHLVPARASAWIQAFPSAERVRLDALWGFPDGLLHLPHDSYFYYPDEDRSEKTLRYKGVCLLFEEGAWTYSDVGRPDDWETTLDDDEVRTLARWSLQLARELNTQVQLMALARIGGLRGPNGCLPWHYTTFDIPQYTESMSKLPITKEIKSLVGFEDLNVPTSSESTVQAYALRPHPSLLRDTKFLKEVGRYVAKQNRPLYFEGSLLGHAYSILHSSGAHVVPIISEPISQPKRYYKLVRDEIPTIIKKAGGLARLRTLSKADARMFLARKLLEESIEVWYALETKEIASELADVIEVVDALRDQCGISLSDVEEIRQRKRLSRGGFEKLVYLEETRPGSLASTRGRSSSPFLFADDEDWLGAPADGEPLDLKLEELDREGGVFRCELSLIPPISRVAGTNAITAHSKNHEISATYDRDRILVTISRKKPERAKSQLSLFKDDDEPA